MKPTGSFLVLALKRANFIIRQKRKLKTPQLLCNKLLENAFTLFTTRNADAMSLGTDH